MPSATLLLPVSSWTKNYVAVSPFDFGDTGQAALAPDRRERGRHRGPHRADRRIAAGGGTCRAPGGRGADWTLSKGQVLQFLQRMRMSGKPDRDEQAGGRLRRLGVHLPPLLRAATTHSSSRSRPSRSGEPSMRSCRSSRAMRSFSPDVREQVPYTIVGAVDGTDLTYEPSRPLNAPETLVRGVGELHHRPALRGEEPGLEASVPRQRLHDGRGRTAADRGAPTRRSGFVNVRPPISTSTATSSSPTSRTPRPRSRWCDARPRTGFVPVELECGGPITDFAPLGSSGQYEYAWVKLTSSVPAAEVRERRVQLRTPGGAQHRSLRGHGLGHGCQARATDTSAARVSARSTTRCTTG